MFLIFFSNFIFASDICNVFNILTKKKIQLKFNDKMILPENENVFSHCN